MKLCSAAFVFILLSFNVQAVGVSLSPSSQEVAKGSTFTALVILDPEGSNVYGAQFSLVFDPARIEALSIEKGALLGSGGASTIEGAKIITSEKVTYSLSRSGTATGINTSGTLASVTFRGLEAGIAAINFVNVTVSDPNAIEIPSTTSGGSVNVTPSPAITAPESPSAAQTPQQSPGAVPQNNTNNTAVTLSSAGSVSEGDEFTIDVYIKTAEPVYGAELKVLYDINLMEGISIGQGSFLGGSPVVNDVNNERGEMVYAETRMGNVTGARGEGILAKAAFRAAKAGNTTVVLKDIKLVSDDGNLISDVLYSGIDMTILERKESKTVDAAGAFLVLFAFLILVLRRRL